jgi:hypothetical protein
MSFNNQMFAANNTLFTIPIISLSDSEDLNEREFELYPESKPALVQLKNAEKEVFLNSCGSRSVLKSKTGATEDTRANSTDSLTVCSGPLKSIKKVKRVRKTALKKKRSVKASRKTKKTGLVTHYHQEGNSEFTSQFRKDFLNAKPLKKVTAVKRFKFVESELIANQQSTFPLFYSMEYQQPQDGLESEDFSIITEKDSNTHSHRRNSYQLGSSTLTSSRPQVTFTSLSGAINRSKKTNQLGGAACFETFKSMKVLSLVCSYMDSDE